ncbi:MAG: hypothetical protein GFGODING_02210 [Flavobacteriales bacterium]|nr:hypothetical protein [Flavobacteriales bacterium]
MVVRHLVLCAGLFVSASLFGQARNYNVLFGSNYWLNLYNEVATVIPCTWSITKRSASISEPDGALSLVVDETGIHNANFDLVQGGSAQDLGWPAELASLLILPKPGATQHYAVFVNTTEATKQAGHVEVDLNANGGAGAVVGAGTTWYMTGCTGKLAATLHANNTDYWLLQHADGSDAFQAYLFNASGLAQTPVISNTGPVIGPTGILAKFSTDYHGDMRFSVMGDQLIMAYAHTPDTAAAALYWFDPASGTVSLRTDALLPATRVIDIFTGDTLLVRMRADFVCGVDLEPSSNHAYMCLLDTTRSDSGYNKSVVIQYDLGFPDPEIARSALGKDGSSAGLSPWGEDTTGNNLLFGADGKLYLRGLYTGGGSLLRLPELPITLTGPTINWEYIYMGNSNFGTWGLPLFCKRYHDSDPAWLGLREEDGRDPAFRAVPNPIGAQGALVWGNSPPPDRLVWRDAMGRVVRSEPALNDGPTTVLVRKELPAGLYALEVFRKGRPLGSTRVIIE